MNGQKVVRSCVADRNAAAQAMLEAQGFKKRERHTCLRLERPEQYAAIEMKGVTVRRAWYDDYTEVYRFLERQVPRTERRTRSLLKTDTYAIMLAYQGKKMVAVAELDMRHGDVATVEYIEGKPSLLHKGLGNALMAEAVKTAFDHQGVEFLDFLMSGTDRKRVDTFVSAGFHVRDEFIAYECKV